MHPLPLLRATAIRPLLDHLARSGASANEVCGARLAALGDTDALLPLSTAGAAFARAAEVLAEPDLGLRVGGSTQLERAGPLGPLARGAPTLASAIAKAVQFGSHFNTGQRFWVVMRGDDLWLHRTDSPSLARGRREVSDMVLMLALGLVRLAAGAAWRPTELCLEGAPPQHAEQLAALATRTVHFGSPSTAIAIPRRLLALPIPVRRDSPAPGADAPLPSADLRESLRQTIEALLRLGKAEISAAAEAAGTSVRSLQRQLSREGLSFAELVQQVRCRAAMRLLADPRRKIVEVSAALGYTDSANFTRAFRRWTGLSPQAFRRAAAELPIEVMCVTPTAVSPASLPIG